MPLGVKVRCGNIVCGMVVCVNVERVNLGPQPVGASDARGSSERLRRFMQRVALVRNVINKPGVVYFEPAELWDGYTWGSVRPEARTGQRPGNTRPEADP